MSRLWNPLSYLRTMATDQRAAADMALRWTRAFRADPDLAADIIRLGRVLEARPARFAEGIEQPDPIDPVRLAFEEGRRDLALKLLAAGHLGQNELNRLMEATNVA